jgi:succinyl-CoA synthetase beta subunit
MKIHEYQAKSLFHSYGIPIPKGNEAGTPVEAVKVAESIGAGPYILKAQVHAGGRGKGGGIRVAETIGDVKLIATELLGSVLVTPQTGEEGKPVNSVLVEEVLDVSREIYLGIVIDRSKACATVLASAEGGMEIEKVASEHPERVFTEAVHPGVGLRPFQASRIAYLLGFDGSQARRMQGIIMGLYRLFVEKDCSLAEINPLVVTGKGDLVALDAKVNFDDNALFRHPEVNVFRDLAQENPLEIQASKYNLNYIKLKGNVGCMVNGAGLAMATMDLIKHVGAEPANFLDVGGGATSEMVREGLKILLSDADVKVIFINIFGGILRCDTLATGVVEAAGELHIHLPMVVRLEGTNVELGRRIFAESGLTFTVARDMKDAAEKVSALVSRR